MPRNIAKFHIVGQVGKVDERGNVTHVSIATNSNRKDENGEWQTEVAWHRVTCFGGVKEQAEKLEKGDLVMTEGRIKDSNYEKDGETVYGIDFLADYISILTKKSSAEEE